MGGWGWRSLRPHHYRRISIEADKESQASTSSSRTSSPAPQVSFLLGRIVKRSRKWNAVLLVLCLAPALLWLTWLVFGRGQYPQTYHPLTEITFPTEIDNVPSGTRQLVIVLPADSPSPDLCKVISSAIALGYPSPVIVNWGKDFRKDGEDFGTSHLGKITGTLEYLEAATRFDATESGKLAEDDLVLVLDAYDVWFQLPPQVLMTRYHQELTAANRRLREQWRAGGGGGGGDDDSEMPMQQTILISAQKSCWPFSQDKPGSDLHCDALPNSTLPEDLFGDDTDVPRKGFHEMRPRYVNSGSIMGPAGDMRRYHRRVKERMDRAQGEGWAVKSDQGIFAEILGEQEIWRRWRREQHERGFDSEGMAGVDGPGMIQENFEFHVALDYTQRLFLPTVYVDKDGDFVALSSEEQVRRHSTQLHISPPRVQGVPEDLADIRPPFDNIGQQEGLSTWGEVPLYVDFFTTAVPVLVHHNAWAHGLKARRSTWWDRTWYFPRLRELMQLHMRPDRDRVLARVGDDLRYMTPRYDRRSKQPKLFRPESWRRSGLKNAQWDEVCSRPNEKKGGSRQWYDEVFRDGLGSL